MGEDFTRGYNAATNRDPSAGSGWVTTQQAARALDVTARTIRWHIEKGNIEAVPQGEGVKRTWLVSIDSLQNFRDARHRESRQSKTPSPRTDRTNVESADISPDIPGDAIRELADRLVEEASKATEFRVRLELTEQAQSTLEEELEAERLLRAEAERERDELAARLAALTETPQAPETTAEEPERVETPVDPGGSQEATERRSWWRRFFGFE